MSLTKKMQLGSNCQGKWHLRNIRVENFKTIRSANIDVSNLGFYAVSGPKYVRSTLSCIFSPNLALHG
jgi:hypothetical protein